MSRIVLIAAATVFLASFVFVCLDEFYPMEPGCHTEIYAGKLFKKVCGK